MEVQFDIFCHNYHDFEEREILEVITDNILSNAMHGMKTQCVYFNIFNKNRKRKAIFENNSFLDSMNKKSASVVSLKDNGLFRIGKDATVRIVEESEINPSLIKKYDAVHWITSFFESKMLKGHNKQVHFYGFFMEKVICKLSEAWKPSAILRFIYHAPSINNETENEGDISICRACEYCGKSFSRDVDVEAPNSYIFENIEYGEDRIERYQYDYTRDDVVKAYKKYISIPDEPNQLSDFFKDRTDVCGIRYLSGEKGKDLKEITYVKKVLCPYASEHLVTAANSKKQ